VRVWCQATEFLKLAGVNKAVRLSVALWCVARLQGGEGVCVEPVERGGGGGVALRH
jgi:hypothetical protein